MSEEKVIPIEYQSMVLDGKKLMIFEQHVEMEMENGMTKAITLADFHAALGTALNVEDNSAGYLLPSNCYYFAPGAVEVKLWCYYPGKVREITHIGGNRSGSTATKKYKIPFPNTIVTHKMRRNGDQVEWQDSRYFATSKTLGQLPMEFIWTADPSQQIWALPFTNVYDEGRLCYGSNSKPQAFTNNFRGLDWHFSLLFNSPFNDDLGIRNTVDRWNPADWYTELTKHTTFPYEFLKSGIKVTDTESEAATV
jgi:hypothetical protein